MHVRTRFPDRLFYGIGDQAFHADVQVRIVVTDISVRLCDREIARAIDLKVGDLRSLFPARVI